MGEPQLPRPKAASKHARGRSGGGCRMSHQQMGVWIKKLVAIVPSWTISFSVFGIGVAPPGEVAGKEPPSCGCAG